MNSAPFLDEKRLDVAMADWQRQCGRRLHAKRKAAGWNQTQLAELVGVTTSSISKFEIGLVTPRDSLRFSIACVLFCEVADIWTPMERAFVTMAAKAA